MSEDGLKIEIADTSVSFSASEELVKKSSGLIDDVLSPFGQSMGLIGEAIKIQRQKVVLLGYDKIIKIATERGLKLKPVTPKFFVEWSDAASLENPKENLLDMWAELFVKASSEGDFSGNNLMFMRLLREITVGEADLLKKIAPSYKNLKEYTSRDWRLNPVEYTEAGYKLAKEANLQLNPESYTWIQVKEKSLYEAHNYLIDDLKNSGYTIKMFASDAYGNVKDKNNPASYAFFEGWMDKAHTSGQLNLLKSLNLIGETDLGHELENPKYEFCGEIYYPMPVAFDFLKACLGNQYPADLIDRETL